MPISHETQSSVYNVGRGEGGKGGIGGNVLVIYLGHSYNGSCALLQRRFFFIDLDRLMP